MEGRAVQIEGGDRKVVERPDPLAVAEELSLFGDLHVIDLDRAFGRGDNEKIIRQIVSRYPAQVGGGIRDPQVAEALVRAGARRVVIGSAAFTQDGVDHDFLARLCRVVRRDRIVIALDTRSAASRTGLDPERAVVELERYAGGFLYTAVEADGIREGSDLEAIRRLRLRTRLPICAAGGMTRPEDVRLVLDAGASAILGLPVYTGQLNLVDAFAAALDWGRGAGLLPTLVRDEPGRTLMVAYSNADSLKAALRERRGIFYARSRAAIWRKGERSGHIQRLRRVRFDCDRDSLLFVVDQEGVACHLGYYSCFQDVRPDTLERLEWTILSRSRRPRRGSYTCALLQDPPRIRDKLLSEARSLAEAERTDEVASEAADLLYYLLVLLVSRGLNLGRVLSELRGREREEAPPGSKKRKEKESESERRAHKHESERRLEAARRHESDRERRHESDRERRRESDRLAAQRVEGTGGYRHDEEIGGSQRLEPEERSAAYRQPVPDVPPEAVGASAEVDPSSEQMMPADDPDDEYPPRSATGSVRHHHGSGGHPPASEGLDPVEAGEPSSEPADVRHPDDPAA